MAIDNTPPRLKLIVTIAVITVITLIAIDFVTKSYFAMMSDEAKHEKIAPTRDKDEQNKAVQAAFAQAQLPIDQAMADFEKGQRPADITPNPSDDIAPVTGWSKLPHPAPTVQHPVAAGANAPEATSMIGDGGVMLYADGGVMHGPDGGVMLAPMGDAGAPTATGDAGATTNEAGDAGARHHRGRPTGGNGGGTGTGQGTGDGTGGGHH